MRRVVGGAQQLRAEVARVLPDEGIGGGVGLEDRDAHGTSLKQYATKHQLDSLSLCIYLSIYISIYIYI